MGFHLPSGVVNTDSVMFVADATLHFSLVKELSDQTLVMIHYGQLTPPLTLTGNSFTVDVTSNPQLVVSYPQIDMTGDILSFLLSGGIEGQQYNISVTVNPGATPRTDVLTVSIPSFADCDCVSINPIPDLYTQVPFASNTYVNTGARYFWGTQPPANPNVMDQWYSSDTNTLYERATDGVSFFWQTIASTNLVAEAPSSNLLYSRYNGYWVPDIIQSDAPADGVMYTRRLNAWYALPQYIAEAPGGGIRFGRYNGTWQPDAIQTDAPNNANTYGRKGNAWTALLPIISEAPQNGLLYSRVNAGWQPDAIQTDAPPDGQFYARNNRMWIAILINEFLTDGPSDGTLYGRQNGAWVAAYPASNPNNYTTAAQVAASVALMMPRQGGNFTGAIGAPGLILANGPATLQLGGGGQPGQVLVAANTSSTLAWGMVPIPEPPNDGAAYARQNGLWVPTASGAGVPEAPLDGTTYSRKSATWVHLTHTDITDWTATLNSLLAPYALITQIPLGATTFPLMDGTNAIGTATNWARADHVHPTDTSRYAATNPAGYQTAAQVTAALGPYALASSVPLASNAAPTMNGVAAPGGATAYSRGDHIHPTDTSLYPTSNPAGYQTAAQVTASLGAYLPLAGGTLTGTLNGTSFTANGNIAVQSNTTNADIWWRRDNTHPRWLLRAIDAPSSETGGNAGANFAIYSYDDTGTIIAGGPEFSILRATGRVTIPNGLSLSNSGITCGSNVATGVDLSKHLTLYSTTYGFNVVSGALQAVAQGAVAAAFTSTGVTLPADPTANLQAATKQYVDNANIDCGTF